MKKLILSIVAIATISLTSFGQAPEGFKYQAVIRDASSTILNNQAVGMQMTIQQGSVGGTTVYQETFAPTTNAYGLVNLEIGSGTVVSGDFTTIDWSAGPYFIETAFDATGGTSYVIMGTSQLMSVPYALHAKTAENVVNDAVDDADNDPTNEIETWGTLSGIPSDFSDNIDNVDDADNDPTNEIETWGTLSGIPSDFSDDIDNVDDADNDPTNEIETWGTLSGIPADFSDNIDNVDDADNDPTNEIELPATAGTNDFLVWNGTDWVAEDLGGLSLSTLATAPTSYATAGNIQFRYNSTATGGYIEARTISGWQNTMVFATKRYSTWTAGGSPNVENYHNSSSLSTTWSPVMSLWDGVGWNDRVTLTTYTMFEGTMWDMGSGGPAPSPKCWKFYAAIDGYNQVFIRAVYQGE